MIIAQADIGKACTDMLKIGAQINYDRENKTRNADDIARLCGDVYMFLERVERAYDLTTESIFGEQVKEIKREAV